MSERSDLMALDDRKLIALANKGLVKRAHKELASETEYDLSVNDEGEVTLRREQVETTLPPGVGLADTLCSCGAAGLCRHRIFAVLAYQKSRTAEPLPAEGPWNPAEFDEGDLKTMVGPAVYSSALAHLRRGLQAQVRSGEVPTVLLPTCTVSFLVPNDLLYARCDCAASGPCEHIPLAVWACRETTSGRVTLGTERGGWNLDGAAETVAQLLQEGVVQAPQDLPQSLDDVAADLLRQGLPWMSDLATELKHSVLSYRGRLSDYSSLHHAGLLAEWEARRRAAQAVGGELKAAALLGVGEPPETTLEHIRLTGLGARVSDRGEAREVEIYLADPDTGTVLVLARRFRRSPRALGRESVVKGVRVDALATGQLVTGSAKRRANRSLALGRSRVARSEVYSSSGDWAALFREPLLVTRFAELPGRFRELGPASLRSRVLAEQVVILQPHRVDDLSYDPGTQQVRALLRDEEERCVLLVAEYNAAAPAALDVLYEQLESGVRFVSGHLGFRGSSLCLEPLAVVGDQGVVSPVLAPGSGSVAMEIARRPVPVDPVEAALESAREVLARGAHHGLRWRPHDWETEVERVADRLEGLGLSKLAWEFRALSQAASSQSARAWWNASIRLDLTQELRLWQGFDER